MAAQNQMVTPVATDRIEAPDPSKIVANRRGSIMIASPSEEAAARRQRAAMMKSIDKPDCDVKAGPCPRP